jgi:lysophospholipid acyltransferase (LPLAT)-like uncharacterized protein
MAIGEQRFSLGRKLLIWLVSLLGPILIRMLGSTWRIDWAGEDRLDEIRKSGGKILYAFWHNRILPLAYVYRNRGVKIMISRHGDGELIAVIVEKMGYIAVRGSSSGGGMEAARRFARDSSGADLAITPDGPRGPRQVAQPGAVYVASRGGYNLVPMAVEASAKWELNSWDRFMIPKPFCRLKVTAGEPIIIPDSIKGARIDEFSRNLGCRMNDMTDQLGLELGMIKGK